MNNFLTKGEIRLLTPGNMSEIGESEEHELRYILVRSTSTVIASASNKLSTWVSLKMDSGWAPHGPPQVILDADAKFHMIQAMTKD